MDGNKHNFSDQGEGRKLFGRFVTILEQEGNGPIDERAKGAMKNDQW